MKGANFIWDVLKVVNILKYSEQYSGVKEYITESNLVR